MRAVGQAEGRGLRCRRLVPVELLLRLLERLHLLGRAVAQADVLARDEEDLADRNGVRDREPLASLQDVAELRLVRVPVGLTRTMSIGATGRSIMLKIGV